MDDKIYKQLILDRVEEELAVFEAEDGSSIALARELLPQGSKEGDVFTYDGDTLILDEQATAARADRIRQKMDLIFGSDR